MTPLETSCVASLSLFNGGPDIRSQKSELICLRMASVFATHLTI